MAKQISQEEYARRRQNANEDSAECKRRGIILLNEIRSRPAEPSLNLVPKRPQGEVQRVPA